MGEHCASVIHYPGKSKHVTLKAHNFDIYYFLFAAVSQQCDRNGAPVHLAGRRPVDGGDGHEDPVLEQGAPGQFGGRRLRGQRERRERQHQIQVSIKDMIEKNLMCILNDFEGDTGCFVTL